MPGWPTFWRAVESRQRPRWLTPLLVLLSLAAAMAWVLVDRHRAALEGERRDRPYLELLSQLSADSVGVTARELPIHVRADEAALGLPATMRVLGLALDGVEQSVHAVVINHFRGVGSGPEGHDLRPFREKLTELEVRFTFEVPATCGHPRPGPPPPLLLTVELPSGKQVTQRVPIFGPYSHTADGQRVNDLDWTHAMAEAACRGGDY